VFGAGTVQWSWGLDNTNAWNQASTDPSGKPPDLNMQQMTVNLLADMGAQPSTLLSGLVTATASTDTTAPSSTITAPASGASLQDAARVTVTGSATDSGAGVVAGVEVSTDGGNTWHPAALTTAAGPSVNWSYAWIAHGSSSTTINSRAVDDSGNLETPSAGVSVNVGCPCSLWGTTLTAPTDSGDATGIEVGVKFTSDTFGTLSGIRFYKVPANTGTHVGNLWTSAGQLLARATFSGETSSGWQQVNFSTPVPINPNATYVASYYAPVGHYAQGEGYFYPPPSPEPVGGGTIDSPPLQALRNTGSTVNGVYQYSASSRFPTSTFNAENYWVDVSFSPAPPPGPVTGVSATAGNASASVTWIAPSSGGAATSYTVTPYIGATARSRVTVTGTPLPTSTTVTGLVNGTTYTFTVTANNPNGSGPPSSASGAVTPLGIAALEYSGLLPVSDATVVDQAAHSTGPTSAAATVSSGATAPRTTSDELAVGFYVDSGFGDTLSAGSGFTGRTNVSQTSDMEFLVEDQLPGQGVTPNASTRTGANTIWLMSTVVFKHA
jgi:hypothetical protein